jgi:hypothetical protein
MSNLGAYTNQNSEADVHNGEIGLSMYNTTLGDHVIP